MIGRILDRLRTSRDGEGSRARKPHIAVVGHLAGSQLFGAERSLLDILAAVDRQAFDLSCVLPASNQEYLRAIERHTTNIHVFSYPWWNKTQPFDPTSVCLFESLFRRARVDLVHVNTITVMDPLLAAKRLQIPTVLHVRELLAPDDMLVNMFGETPSAIVNKVLSTSDFVIANSEATHHVYRKAGRSFRLYNCVDTNHFDLLNHVEPGRLKVGIISSNHPDKGITAFVNLAKLARTRRSGVQFFVIGPQTDYISELQQQAGEEAGPENLHFIGYTADPLEAIRQVNVVVSFSLFAESFGRSIAEAMAGRRPVIGYRSGALPELIRHNRDGFLIPRFDYARALDHLEFLADNPDRVLEMGHSGRERVRQMFSTRLFKEQLNHIYQQILANSRPEVATAERSSNSLVPRWS